MNEPICTALAPAAIGPYAQAIRSGGTVYVSGQIPLNPLNPADGSMPATVEEQARQALLNLQHVLEAAGCSLADVVKTTVFIQHMGDFAAINAVYASFFKEPFPARSCVAVAALPKGALLEIDAIAVK